jgi:hypothetical protein
VKFTLEEARKAYKNAIYVQETINNQKVVKPTPAKKKSNFGCDSTTQKQQMSLLTVLLNSTQDHPLRIMLPSALHTGEVCSRKYK